MITKETVKNIFGAAGSPMPALDRVVTLFLSSVDNRSIRGLSAEDIAVKVVEWYKDTAVNDEVVNYFNRNLRYYPTAEFLKTSLDEYTIFQMSVSFSSPFPIRRLARRSIFPTRK